MQRLQRMDPYQDNTKQDAKSGQFLQDLSDVYDQAMTGRERSAERIFGKRRDSRVEENKQLYM